MSGSTTKGVSIDWSSPGPVATDFLDDTRSRFKGIRGPFGSGKSVLCCINLAMLALTAPVSVRDGIRKTRILVVRNTNPQLRTTTIKTWLDWFPENQFGPFRWSPPFTHHWKAPYVPGVDAEFIFMPMDTEDALAKVLSLEITHVWFNEARELPKAVIDAAMGRLFRYPSVRDVPKDQVSSVGLADTNSPGEEHWWPIMSGDVETPTWITDEDAITLVKPDNWRFFAQPAAVLDEKVGNRLTGYRINPNTENLSNVGETYYRELVKGKTRKWIQLYAQNKYGTMQAGRPVYEDSYDEELHEIADVWPEGKARIIVGVDFGLTPAIAWLWEHAPDSWVQFDEDVFTRGDAVAIADRIKSKVKKLENREGLEPTFEYWGDPGGKQGAQTDSKTPISVMNNKGVPIIACDTNETATREGAVTHLLGSLGTLHQPRLVFCNRCSTTRAGMSGGYRRGSRVLPGDQLETIQDNVVKNIYSHICEAVQYAALGTGAGDEFLANEATDLKPINARAAERRMRKRFERHRHNLRRA